MTRGLFTIRLVSSLLVGLVALAGCGPRDSPEAARARVRKAFLEKQIAGLHELVAKAERGEVVTTDQIAISVDEGVANELLNASLPQERMIGGKLRVRIDAVEAFFRGTQSILAFRARATSDGLQGAYADLELAGGLSELSLRDGRLSAKVSLEHFSVLKASVGPLAQGVVEHLVRDNLGILADAVPPFEIPVRLDQTIRIGGFKEGPVSAAGGQLPLTLAVSQVLQINRKLWVLIDAKAGPWERIEDTPTPDAPTPDATTKDTPTKEGP
jgi:predicted transcriptional regulator